MSFWLVLFILIYLEIIYHIFCFGFTVLNPVFTLGLIFCVTGLEVLVISLFRKKGKTISLWVLLALDILIYGAQLIYWQIFEQPLLIAAAVNAGGDAVTTFWREMFSAIGKNWLPLALMLVILIPVGFLYKKRKEIEDKELKKQRIKYACGFLGGILIFGVGMLGGKLKMGPSIELYQEFSNPAAVFEEYGVLAGMQRDVQGMIFGNHSKDAFLALGSGAAEEEEIVEEILPEENVLPIDFETLIAQEGRPEVQALHQYVQNRKPTTQNDYTGMFEGYNLIYLTAEGFAPYCIDETLTPTLYRLTHSGFQFENYYVPLWRTSTSDGEFTNCTGLVPDGQFSMRRTGANGMNFTLPRFWQAEGVQSYAYHNNSLSYYDRYQTHANLGYFFKAGNSGKLSSAEWADHLFQMENPKAWPQSDLEMMQATVGDYINQPRFHAYYMTISGHLEYNFSGNDMAKKNQEAVAALPYSERSKAYVACNIELDKALEYLITELENAGKLDNTVICLATDHYPYGLEEPEIAELRGAPLAKSYDLYHNSLILWNSKMDPVVVEKPCSSVDILPTLLNLFGFEYDSRLYCGQDILSDSSPLVAFADKSFMTDRIYYDARSGAVESLDGTEVDPEYVERMKKQVDDTFVFSAGVLNFDYYRTLDAYAPVPVQ